MALPDGHFGSHFTDEDSEIQYKTETHTRLQMLTVLHYSSRRNVIYAQLGPQSRQIPILLEHWRLMQSNQLGSKQERRQKKGIVKLRTSGGAICKIGPQTGWWHNLFQKPSNEALKKFEIWPQTHLRRIALNRRGARVGEHRGQDLTYEISGKASVRNR